MRSTIIAPWFVSCAFALNLAASSQDSTEKPSQSNEEARAAKEHTMTGCLQKGAEPLTFVVQNTEPNGPKMISIVDSKVDLQGYLGLKVAITGAAVTEKAVATMKPKPSKADHYMTVTSAKLITTACP